MKQIKTNAQPPHLRARQEAREADITYRTAVRRADRERLALEDRIEETLKLLQRWEMDRLRAVKDGKPLDPKIKIKITIDSSQLL
jgi:hypothetical protein